MAKTKKPTFFLSNFNWNFFLPENSFIKSLYDKNNKKKQENIWKILVKNLSKKLDIEETIQKIDLEEPRKKNWLKN